MHTFSGIINSRIQEVIQFLKVEVKVYSGKS